MSKKTIVVGEGQIATNCIRLLSESGFSLTHVVSTCPFVTKAANEVGAKSLKQIEELTSIDDFDFLFSIVYLEKIPAKILQKVKTAAINYHDGPLPDISGLNTTSWSILKGREYHGISWHLMTDDIDAGDILSERRFPIDKKDSSLSLNIKCANEALESFDEVLAKLKTNTIKGSAQTGQGIRIKRRDRPKNYGFVSRDMSFDEVDKLVRALDFGPFKNTLCLAKILLGGRVYFMKKTHRFKEQHTKH